MLRSAIIELKARRSCLHLAAYAVALGACWIISSVPLPSLQEDARPGDQEHLAYGYLYFPIIATPIIASWLNNPFSDAVARGTRRLSRIAAACSIFALTLAVLGSFFVGWRADGFDAAIGSVENAAWTVALIIAFRGVVGSEWATLIVVAYGALGLFLPSLWLLVINREPSVTGLVVALLVITGETYLTLSPRWARFFT